MTIYRYEEVRAQGRKSGPCVVCGKDARRQRTFTNTINPFNRKPDGAHRSRAEVVANVQRLAREWEAEPLRHVRCEP